MKIRLLLSVLLLLCATAVVARKKPEPCPDCDKRIVWAGNLYVEMDREGWAKRTSVRAVQPQCGFMCWHAGDATALRVYTDQWDAEAVSRFWRREMQPRRDEMIALGFTCVQFFNLAHSPAHPNGTAAVVLSSEQTEP
jgi:hypothetical protein